MNRYESFPEGEAQIDFGDGDFVVLRPGAYVICAVTGDRIPVDELRYWNADLNEPYRDADAALTRWKALQAEKGS
jgi:hypothetical protein